MSTDKYIFPQVVAPWMEAAKPTPEQVSKLIHDWTNYGLKSGKLLQEQADRIAELEAQLAAVQKDAAWQPIETAPKDGKESLFYTHEIGLCVMYWDDLEQAWGTGFDDEKPTPTHWMPLPKPPLAGEATVWQPIETAPKDGTMVLLGRPEDTNDDSGSVSTAGRWQKGWEDSVDDMGCDDGFVDVDYQEFSPPRSFGATAYRSMGRQPTHWKPLPPPPIA